MVAADFPLRGFKSSRGPWGQVVEPASGLDGRKANGRMSHATPCQEDQLELEVAIRDHIHDTFERNRAADLSTVRRRLRELFLCREITRTYAIVSANDVRKIIADENIPPGNWLGSVFKTSGWVSTGQTIQSTTPGRHGSRILTWRMSE